MSFSSVATQAPRRTLLSKKAKKQKSKKAGSLSTGDHRLGDCD
jgi:hypothetical protein